MDRSSELLMPQMTRKRAQGLSIKASNIKHPQLAVQLCKTNEMSM